MKEYTRQTPQFSLCGLNCCLCPRYRTSGDSRCPGCGGEDFCEKHPPCGIISCSKRHGDVAYCFLCEDYPCERYQRQNEKDSFITYLHVPSDMDEAKEGGLDLYLKQLAQKSAILDELLRDFDNGRMKSYYCLAVNLLPLQSLEEVMKNLHLSVNGLDSIMDMDVAARGKRARTLVDAVSSSHGITLKLRK